MSLETRHTEKNILCSLLLCSNGVENLHQVIIRLKATMEPEDVELVEKRVAELLKELN